MLYRVLYRGPFLPGQMLGLKAVRGPAPLRPSGSRRSGRWRFDPPPAAFLCSGVEETERPKAPGWILFLIGLGFK